MESLCSHSSRAGILLENNVLFMSFNFSVVDIRKKMVEKEAGETEEESSLSQMTSFHRKAHPRERATSSYHITIFDHIAFYGPPSTLKQNGCK